MAEPPPKFSFVPTLALGAAREDAQRVFGEALGCPQIDADDAHIAYGFGRQALYVDVSGSLASAFGFLPSFAVDDLERGIAHLKAHGCAVQPLPWDPHAPGRLVQGPGGLAFCLVGQRDVERMRAGPPRVGLLADGDDEPLA